MGLPFFSYLFVTSCGHGNNKIGQPIVVDDTTEFKSGTNGDGSKGIVTANANLFSPLVKN